MNDLKNDKKADTFPLLRAVKKEEENILMPAKINEKAQIQKPRTVILYKAVSYPTKRYDKGPAKTKLKKSIKSDVIEIRRDIFLKTPFSSVLFPDP